MKSSKMIVAAAAFSGLIAGSATFASAGTQGSSSSQVRAHAGVQSIKLDDTGTGKHACKGQNACKGEGGCKAGDNGCKGKNSCKGKGGCSTMSTPSTMPSTMPGM